MNPIMDNSDPKERIAKLIEAADGEGLVKLLSGEELNVRVEAAKALGQLRQLEVVPDLINAMGDVDLLVRQAAAESLVEVGEEAVPALVATLKGSGGRLTPHALWALGEIGSRNAVDALLTAAESPSWRLRWSAIESLGDVGGERAIEALINALGDRDQRVRSAAGKALMDIGEPAVEYLSTSMQHPDRGIRRESKAIVERLDTPAGRAALRRAQLVQWVPVIVIGIGILMILLWLGALFLL